MAELASTHLHETDGAQPYGERDNSKRMAEQLRQHENALRGYAQRLSNGHWDVADDIFQETCLQAWKNKHRLDYSRCCKPWLLRVMKNEFLQIVRNGQRQIPLAGDVGEHTGEITAAPISQLEFLEFLRVLSSLAPTQQSAILLVLAYGYTYSEAASLLNTQPGTVKSRVARGREKLASLLDTQHAA